MIVKFGFSKTLLVNKTLFRVKWQAKILIDHPENEFPLDYPSADSNLLNEI